ncbi:MAG: tandem-95 repeat protein [Planctomycetota bacterium]
MIGAGEQSQQLQARALTDLFNGTLLPFETKPVATASVNDTNLIVIDSGANITAATNAYILAQTNDLDLLGQATRATTYSGENSLDQDRSFGSRFRDESVTSNNNVIVNGNVRVNADRQRLLTLRPNNNTANPYDVIQTRNVGDIIFNQATEAINIRAYVERLVSLSIATRASQNAGFEAPGEQIERNAELQRLIAVVTSLTGVSLASEPELLADWDDSASTQDADVDRLMTLVPETVEQQSIDLDPISVSLGDIYTAGTLTGSGLLSAPRNAEVEVDADIPLELNVGDISIPFQNFGRVLNDQFEVTSHPTLRLFENADERSDPTITILSDYGSNPSESLPIPAINLIGDVENVFGGLLVQNSEGAVEINGAVRAGSIEVISGGDFYLSAPEPVINSAGNPVLESRFGVADPSVVNLGGDAELRQREFTRNNYDQLAFTERFVDDDFTDVADQFNLDTIYRYLYDVPTLGDSVLTPIDSSGIKASGNIYITARVINVNGAIESGEAFRGLTINREIDTLVARLRSEGHTNFVEIPRSEGNVSYYTGDIDLFYDPLRDRLEMDRVQFKGGYVNLKGQVVSTGNGSISVLDGYGDVRILDLSQTELYIPEIDAGSGVRGQIDIVDTDGATRETVRANSFNDDGSNNQTYVPRPGYLQSVYLYNREFRATQRYKGPEARLRELEPGFSIDSLPNNVNPVGGLTGIGVSSVFATSVGIVDSSFRSGPELNNLGLDYRMLAYPFRFTDLEYQLGDIIDIPAANDERDRTTIADIDYWVASIAKADFPIQLNFVGSDTANVGITSNSMVTTGTIVARDGSVNIATSGGVNVPNFPIRQESNDAILIADEVNLFGSTITGVESNASDALGNANGFRIDLSGDDSTLRAVASGGDLSIVELEGNLTIDREFRSSHEIDIVVLGGNLLSNLATTSLTGTQIDVSVPSGSIATNAQPLRVDATQKFNALAAGNIQLESPSTGDFPIGSVESTAADIFVTSTGDIVDANSEDIPDVRAIDAILDLYEDARLTRETGSLEIEAEIRKDLIAGRNVEYSTYWTLRGLRFDGETGTYSFDPFDENFVYAPTPEELEELIVLNEPSERYIERRTQQYFDLHALFGGQPYDPEFSYTPTSSELDALLAGNEWNQRQLDNFIDLTALTGLGLLPVTDTEIVIESPNFSSDTLSVSTAGAFGSTDAPFIYRPSEFDSLTIEQQNQILVRLGAAAPSDITQKGDLIEIVRREDIDVAVSTVSILAADEIYLGSDGNDEQPGNVTLQFVTSLGGEVRVKTSGDIMGGSVGVFAATDAMLESSGGEIGTPQDPVEVVADTGTLIARAQDGISLTSSKTIESPLMFTEGNLWLQSDETIQFTGDAIAESIFIDSGGSITAIESATGDGKLIASNIELDADQFIRVEIEGDEALLVAKADQVLVTAENDLVLGETEGQFISVLAGDELRVAPNTVIRATNTAGDTIAFGGRVVVLPDDSLLQTVDRGATIVSAAPGSDAFKVELLGEIQSFNTTVIGTIGEDQITLGRVPESRTRVFTGDGNDTLNLLSTPGHEFEGTGSRTLSFFGGSGYDAVNILGDQTAAASLSLDEYTVNENGASVLLDETTERLNVALISDQNHTITVEKSWALPETTLMTSNGDDTIDVKGLMSSNQSLSIDSGGGNDVITVDQACVEGLIAVDDFYQTGEEQSVDLPVLFNDVNFDAAIGTLELNEAENDDRLTLTSLDGVPVFRYQPPADFTGLEEFTYRIGIGDNVAIGTVRVNVVGVNDAPTAQDDTLRTDEDQSVQFSVLSNDTDPDDDAIVITSFEQPQNGTVIELENGVLKYIPNLDFFGTDSFQYTIVDPGQATSTATVSITVDPVTDVLIAVDDAAITQENANVEVRVLDNDINPDGLVLTPNVIVPPINGTVAPTRLRSFVYTPDPGFSGEDQFVYQLRDSAGNVTNAVVTISVSSVTPLANVDTTSVLQDGEVSIDVLENDEQLENSPVQVAIDLDPDFGTVRVTSDNRVVYTPKEGFFGTDSFRYVVTDGLGNSDDAIVNVRVNALPVADSGGPYVIREGDDLTLDGAASLDPEGGDLTYRWDIDGDGDFGIQ